MTILTLTADLNGTLDTTLTSPQGINVSNQAITYSKIQNAGTLSLIGNPTTTIESPSEIAIGTSLYFKNAGTLARSAITGDIVINADGTVARINGKNWEIYPTITTSQNNWNPTGIGTSNVVKFTSSSYNYITGITAGTNGQELLLTNVGSIPVKLTNQDTNSLGTNRFNFNQDVFLAPNDAHNIIYDGTSETWKATNQLIDNSNYFGSGHDGTVTISSGTVTLTRDMYYKSLILTGGTVFTNGWKIFVSELLDISNAHTNNIMFCNPSQLASSGTVVGFASGNSVLAGGPGIAAGTTGNQSYGQNGGLGANCAGTQLQPTLVYRYINDLNIGILGGCGGAESNLGPSGAGGGVIFISARYINRGTNTSQSIINTPGGHGHNAGGGGWVYLAYSYLFGTSITNAISANGGTGAANGTGGRITLLDLRINNVIETVGSTINCISNL